MEGVAIVTTRGGAGKTSLCHLLALGAAWRQKPAYLMHTDDREPIKVNGRPYAFYDARNPETLSTLIGAIVNDDGLCIIDGGGNRPDFDKWISTSVDLVIIPIEPDPESVKLGMEHLKRLESYGASNVYYLLNKVSSNQHEKTRDKSEYFDLLEQHKIMGEVGRVAAVKRLRDDDKGKFITPPTNVNNLSRKVYKLIEKQLSTINEEQREIA